MGTHSAISSIASELHTQRTKLREKYTGKKTSMWEKYLYLLQLETLSFSDSWKGIRQELEEIDDYDYHCMWMR